MPCLPSTFDPDVAAAAVGRDEILALRTQRERALRFIAHDMRAPQSAILTLLELHAADPGRFRDAELLAVIGRHAREAVSLADDFVCLMRALSDGLQYVEVDLFGVLDELREGDGEAGSRGAGPLDFVWTQRLTSPPGRREAWVWGDRSLLRRALAALLADFPQPSAEGSTIGATLAPTQVGGVPGFMLQLDEIRSSLGDTVSESVDGGGRIGTEQTQSRGIRFAREVARLHGGALHAPAGAVSRFHLYLPVGTRDGTV